MRRGGAYALTPALARESARMGALLARGGAPGMGACMCRRPPRGRGMGSLRGIGAPLLSTSDYTAALQAKLSDASQSAQAELKAETGVDVNQQRVAQGASSAISLAKNGYNPDSPSDNANLVHAIAGGLCLVPGVGPLLGAAVEGLWLVGNTVACPLENAFASIGFGSPSPACGGKTCSTSGNWTAQSVLEDSGINASKLPKGSFASFVIPAIAANTAQSMNCKSGIPPEVVVDAAAAIWNKVHAGPAVDVFVPPLNTTWNPAGVASPTGSAIMIPFWQSVSNSNTGNVDPNLYFAFQPFSQIAAKLKFTASDVKAHFAMYFPPGPGLWITTPGRVVSINSGALLPQTQPIAVHFGGKTLTPKPAPITLHFGGKKLTTTTAAGAKAPGAPMSAGGKVAAAAGVAGAGALAWWLGSHGWKWVTPRWARSLVR